MPSLTTDLETLVLTMRRISVVKRGAELATADDLLDMYYQEIESCDAGWVADFTTRYVVLTPTATCGGAAASRAWWTKDRVLRPWPQMPTVLKGVSKPFSSTGKHTCTVLPVVMFSVSHRVTQISMGDILSRQFRGNRPFLKISVIIPGIHPSKTSMTPSQFSYKYFSLKVPSNPLTRSF